MKDNYYLRQDGEKVFMCCGKAGCPSVEINEDGLIKISDDHGSYVKMNKDEAALISSAVEQLKTFEGDQKSRTLDAN